MMKKLKNFLFDLRDRQRIAIALSKGQVGMTSRTVDFTDAQSWEFSGFSQNGEDGILQVLRRHLTSSNRYFVEIGSGDGIENNSCWLAVTEKYNGVMIDGNPALVERTQRLIAGYNIGVECKSLFVTKESAGDVRSLSRYQDPDVFSLDIDGNDYYIARALVEAGLRPKIWVVEYNSVYGPARSVTIPYDDAFDFKSAHASHLHYGVSVSGWRRFFDSHGYRFITVDRHGVNAFFVDPVHFEASFLDGVRGVPFAENRYQFNKFSGPHDQQYRLIADKPVVEIGPGCG